MRKVNFTKLLLFMALGLVIASCSKDKDDEPTITADIVGVWKCSALNYSGEVVAETGGQSVTLYDFVAEGYDINFTLTFEENPNLATSDGTYSVEITTTMLGQTFTENEELLPFEYIGSWSMEGSNLTITEEGVSTTGSIKELTENSLVLFIVEEETTEYLGTAATSKMEFTIEFTR